MGISYGCFLVGGDLLVQRSLISSLVKDGLKDRLDNDSITSERCHDPVAVHSDA